MKDIINIKNVSDAIGHRDSPRSVEESLFDFTVTFYHALSLINPNSQKKTTKAFMTYLLTKCFVDFIVALEAVTDEVIEELDKIVEASLEVDFKNDSVCSYIVFLFNCETDPGGALFKMATLHRLITERYEVTHEDILECLKTIN